jgi:hypothetical protein
MGGNRTKSDATAELVKLGLPPRLVDAELAAAYCGLSVGAFIKSVDEGRYPQALADGKRRLWDIRALDAAVDRRSGLASSSRFDESPEAIMRAIDGA